MLARELEVDDRVIVYPGEMIPVDGEILEGHALIDQKTITGEGLPVNRGIGEAAFAATVLREGQLTIRATRVGSNTTAGQIVRLIDSAPVGDTRMQNHAEKLADKLVMPTLGLATATAAATLDFDRFLSLVIVDYGTGIRVAAPTAVLSSMTRAARAGIIIKSGRHMERLAEVDTIVFDKTGTLTQGAPAVGDVLPYQKHLDGQRLLGLAAAAESRLRHPVADALRERARQIGAEHAGLRRAALSSRPRRRRPGRRALPPCRQRAFLPRERHRVRSRRARPRGARGAGLFLPLCRRRRQARRPHPLCRPDPSRKPRRDRAAARLWGQEHDHAHRRQRGRGARGQPAPGPHRPFRRHAAGRQGGGHPGPAKGGQNRRDGRRRHQRFARA